MVAYYLYQIFLFILKILFIIYLSFHDMSHCCNHLLMPALYCKSYTS